MKFQKREVRIGRRAGALATVGILGLGWGVALTRTEETAPLAARVREALHATREVALKSTLEVEAPVTEGGWDLANLGHERVDFWVHRFASDPDMREKFEGFLRRSGRYQEMIRDRLKARGMPADLIYLAMIESGFQPHAYSPAAASGLWQFISETGQRYGLRVDGSVDERNDPERATDAALDYLQELHDRFGSWYLAAAAYNTGENRVGRIMREETGSERGTDKDYYRIWNRLPKETRDYVPLMIAAARISKNPDQYGFGHIEPEPPLEYEVTVTDAGFTLEVVAEVSGADLEELELLNPHLRRGRLPRNERFALRLPPGTREAFEDNWPKAVEEQKAATTYKVRRGDNLTVIARRHGVTLSDLRAANDLRGDQIYQGQVLRIESN